MSFGATLDCAMDTRMVSATAFQYHSGSCSAFAPGYFSHDSLRVISGYSM